MLKYDQLHNAMLVFCKTMQQIRKSSNRAIIDKQLIQKTSLTLYSHSKIKDVSVFDFIELGDEKLLGIFSGFSNRRLSIKEAIGKYYEQQAKNVKGLSQTQECA